MNFIEFFEFFSSFIEIFANPQTDFTNFSTKSTEKHERGRFQLDKTHENLNIFLVKAKEIPQEENEEEYKERASQNLMKNVNSEKLKQLLDANVGGGPYSEAVLERKKHSFELLKQWDDAKCGLLQAHRSALEMFAKKIDKKQAFLKNAMFTIKSFFEQRLQQENTYIEFSLKKIPKIAGIYAESGENPEKTSVFPQISQSFAQIDAFVAENAEKHAKTAEFLEKTLLQALIYPEIANYEAVLLRVRDEIVENRRQIARISKEIGEISSSHARFFTETLQKTRPKAAETQDFYDSEVKLLGVSQEQVRLQRLLATNTIKFYREWEKLEENRVKTLQNALKTYAKFSETHANRDNPAQIPGNLASSLENWDFEDDLLRFLDLEEKSQGNYRDFLEIFRFLRDFRVFLQFGGHKTAGNRDFAANCQGIRRGKAGGRDFGQKFKQKRENRDYRGQ